MYDNLKNSISSDQKILKNKCVLMFRFSTSVSNLSCCLCIYLLAKKTTAKDLKFSKQNITNCHEKENLILTVKFHSRQHSNGRKSWGNFNWMSRVPENKRFRFKCSIYIYIIIFIVFTILSFRICVFYFVYRRHIIVYLSIIKCSK